MAWHGTKAELPYFKVSIIRIELEFFYSLISGSTNYFQLLLYDFADYITVYPS